LTSTVTRIVHIFALTGLSGLASERRTELPETDIVPQIFFYLLVLRIGPARGLGSLWSKADITKAGAFLFRQAA
jgi:hypothetical protein